MPLAGKLALARLLDKKELVPTSAVESPSIKRAGTAAPHIRGANMAKTLARKNNEATCLFAIVTVRKRGMIISFLCKNIFHFALIDVIVHIYKFNFQTLFIDHLEIGFTNSLR